MVRQTDANDYDTPARLLVGVTLGDEGTCRDFLATLGSSHSFLPQSVTGYVLLRHCMFGRMQWRNMKKLSRVSITPDHERRVP